MALNLEGSDRNVTTVNEISQKLKRGLIKYALVWVDKRTSVEIVETGTRDDSILCQ